MLWEKCMWMFKCCLRYVRLYLMQRKQMFKSQKYCLIVMIGRFKGYAHEKHPASKHERPLLSKIIISTAAYVTRKMDAATVCMWSALVSILRYRNQDIVIYGACGVLAGSVCMCWASCKRIQKSADKKLITAWQWCYCGISWKWKAVCTLTAASKAARTAGKKTLKFKCCWHANIAQHLWYEYHIVVE